MSLWLSWHVKSYDCSLPCCYQHGVNLCQIWQACIKGDANLTDLAIRDFLLDFRCRWILQVLKW